MLYNFTADEVLLKRKHRFTHLQKFKMLLSICEKKLAIFASIGNYFRPCHSLSLIKWTVTQSAKISQHRAYNSK